VAAACLGALVVSLAVGVLTESPGTVLVAVVVAGAVLAALSYFLVRLLMYGLLPGRLLMEQKKPNVELVRSQLVKLLERPAALEVSKHLGVGRREQLILQPGASHRGHSVCPHWRGRCH
jgi:hypothetical protein